MEKNTIMILILAMVGIIIGAIIMPVVANQIWPMSNTITYTNQSVVSSATANGTVALIGQGYQGTPTIANTSNVQTYAGNFSVISTVGSDQLTHVYLKTLDGAVTKGVNGATVLVTYTSEPVGYTSGAAQGIIPLILIFLAIGVAIIGLWPVVKDFI